MDLKSVFIGNLRRFRAERELTQTRLAELCDTATSYIGEIEIGRRFPSLSLIEKMSTALNVEPYRFFVEQEPAVGGTVLSPDAEAAVNALSRLSERTRLAAIARICGGT